MINLIMNILALLNISNASEANCPYIVERYENTQIQQRWSHGADACFFSVTPRDAYIDLVYRSHLFSSAGLVMIFNSYGQGEEASSTAAREFFTFPRINKAFSHEWDRDKDELILTHITGDRFVFDIRKARLKSMDRAQLVVADYVEPRNRGGVEILNYQGLLLDGGFAFGRAATSYRNGSSTFRDRNGRECKVRNSEIFKYVSDGEVLLKYDDAPLKKFLSSRCRGLATF